jgi:hypothetical protein
MPNLLPDWLPWIRPAGRLLWGIIALTIGMTFFVALLKRPVGKRPVPDRVLYAAFPVILVVGIFAARFLPSVQTVMVWATALAVISLGVFLVATSKGRDPEDPATWAECFAGAVGVFALFILGFAIIPSEWLNYANSYLLWGDTTKFVIKSSESIWFLPIHWPTNFDYPSMRDTVAALIYVVMLGVDLKLWVMWQRRHEVKQAPAAGVAGTPARRSRFGRPVRVQG